MSRNWEQTRTEELRSRVIDIHALKRNALTSWLVMLGVLAVTLALTAGVAVMPLQSLYAQSEEEDRPRQATRRVPAMSEQVFNQLSEAQEHMDNKEYGKAEDLLKKLLERRRLNGNERGQVHNVLAFVAMEKKNNKDMIYHLEQVLAEGDQITEGLEVQTLYTLAQLYFVEEDYDESLEYMQAWLAKEQNPSPAPRVFLAQIYFQMENYREAVKYVESAIEIARSTNGEIKENWWAMLRYFYYELENIPKVIEILKILVRDFPKSDYWVQLCGMYGDQDMEKEMLYCMETAHVGEHLDSESLIRTFQGLLMNAGAPYRSAKYLQEAIDAGIVDDEKEQNLIALAQSYQFAQEQDEAIKAFEAAAEISDKGTTYEQLSQLYFERDEFDKCINAVEKAFDKGGVRQESALHYAKGLCLFNLERLSQSRDAFTEMRRIARREGKDSDEKVASQWIAYIDKERQRRDTLKARQ